MLHISKEDERGGTPQEKGQGRDWGLATQRVILQLEQEEQIWVESPIAPRSISQLREDSRAGKGPAGPWDTAAWFVFIAP